MEAFATTCAHARQLLVGMREAGEPQALPAQLAEHVVACARCRGALSTLAAAVAGLPADANLADCAPCEADLAGYIECELDQGALAAALAYPHVWCHLWLCPACAEVYQLSHVLEVASRSGALPAMPTQLAPHATAIPPSAYS